MTKSFEDILEGLPAERREKILGRADELLRSDEDLRAALDRDEEEERAAMAGPMSFTIYRDDDGLFRFRLVAANGLVIADSASYADREEAARAMESFKLRVFEAAA